VPEIAGAMVCGATRDEAVKRVRMFAHRGGFV
jgi:hypothetical protein